MNYENFGVEDFVMDENFRDWVQYASAGNQSFWENWLAAHPDKARDVREARQIILSIDFREDMSPAERSEVWHRIEAATWQSNSMQSGSKRGFSRIWRNTQPIYRIAAAITLLLACTAVWYFTGFGQQEYQTAFGEIRQITLPDGSVVSLNANSTLRYNRQWSADDNREVWLEGEAFFKITQQTAATPVGKRAVKFTVHTQELDVQVLGTQFNVQDRDQETKVSLNEGKVKILLPVGKTPADEAHTSGKTQEITLEPGQLVAYSREKKQSTKKQINPEVYSAWTSHQYIFQNTSLREIVAMLEHNYGVEVTVQNPELLDQRLTGTVVSDNLETLLKALSATADLEISRDQNQIILRKQD